MLYKIKETVSGKFVGEFGLTSRGKTWRSKAWAMKALLFHEGQHLHRAYNLRNVSSSDKNFVLVNAETEEVVD